MRNSVKTAIPLVAMLAAIVTDAVVYFDFFYMSRTGAKPSEADKFFFSWGWAVVAMLVVVVFTCATLWRFNKLSVKIFVIVGAILSLLFAIPWFLVNFVATHFKP
jgi:hypothetical protein